MNRFSRMNAVSAVIVFAGGLVAAPSGFAQIAVTSQTLVERNATPGEVYRDVIAIHNTSKTAQVVSLSLADYRFDAAGATEFNAPGSQPRSNTGWISLSQRTVAVPPNQDVKVAYTVTVPDGRTAPFGTYWGVVLVEAVNQAPRPRAAKGLAITPKFRYAVQLATNIQQTGESRLAFGPPRVISTGFAVDIRDQPAGASAANAVAASDQSLALEIANTGTRGCRPALRIELYQSDGTLAHADTVRRGLLYPGTSIRQAFKLPWLPTGDYIALLVADVGASKVQGTKFRIRVP